MKVASENKSNSVLKCTILSHLVGRGNKGKVCKEKTSGEREGRMAGYKISWTDKSKAAGENDF